MPDDIVQTGGSPDAPVEQFGENPPHLPELVKLNDKYWSKCSKKIRYHFVSAMSESGMTQLEIEIVLEKVEAHSDGDVESLSQPRISDIVNSESIEEAYTTWNSSQ